MFDDRDELCECVFCNCVFPSAEAAEILANPEGREFKNETFEKQEGSKHYYSTPVMPDLIEKAPDPVGDRYARGCCGHCRYRITDLF